MAIVTNTKATFLKLDTKQAKNLPPEQKRFRKANDPLKIISVEKGPENHWVFHFSPPGLTIGAGPVLSCLAWPDDWQGVGEIFAKVQELNRVRSIGQSTPLQGPNTFKVLDRDASGKVTRCALDIAYKSQVDNALNPGGACNVTCIAMGLVYFDLAKDGAEQLEDRLYAEMEANGNSRHNPYHLQQLAIAYGMADNFAVYSTIEQIKQWVESGRPCVVHGWFTGSGHIVMIVGFDAAGFVVHDPWGEWTSGGYLRNDAANPQRGRYIHYSFGMIDAKCRESDGSFWCHFLDRTGWNPTKTAISKGVNVQTLLKPQEFRITEAARDLINSWEGWRPKQYICQAGLSTIGWGSTRWFDGGGIPIGATINESQARQLQDRDLGQFVSEIAAVIDVPLTENQLSALISWQYNTGAIGAKQCGLRDAINRSAGDAAIVYEFRRWNKAGGEVSPGLVNRRESEVALWEGRDWRQYRG